MTNDDKATGQGSSEQTAASIPSAALGVANRVMSRRAMVRGVSVVVPTIATLHSGAALAQSSNLLSAAPDTAAENGQHRCLDTKSVYPTQNRDVYDLGEEPMGHVTRIRSDKRYYLANPDGTPSSTEANPKQMCKTGGTYYRQDGSRMRRVKVAKGAMVSLTAMSSFSNDITFTDV